MIEPKKCEECEKELTKDNCSYDDCFCDDCYEAANEEDDAWLEDEEND